MCPIIQNEETHQVKLELFLVIRLVELDWLKEGGLKSCPIVPSNIKQTLLTLNISNILLILGEMEKHCAMHSIKGCLRSPIWMFFLEKVQTAFDPPPPNFWKLHCAFFAKKTQCNFQNSGGGGQRPFGLFPKKTSKSGNGDTPLGTNHALLRNPGAGLVTERRCSKKD